MRFFVFHFSGFCLSGLNRMNWNGLLLESPSGRVGRLIWLVWLVWRCANFLSFFTTDADIRANVLFMLDFENESELVVGAQAYQRLFSEDSEFFICWLLV